MKERPILFSGPMVRAILEGRKTQTRRVVNPQPWDAACGGAGTRPIWAQGRPRSLGGRLRSPYGGDGDRLWVRETFTFGETAPSDRETSRRVTIFRADCLNDHPESWEKKNGGPGWVPGIFMPRNQSRLTLEIADIRVERLQEIHRRDVQAEGFLCRHCKGYSDNKHGCICVKGFSEGWDALNAKRGYSWKSNPWVWIIEFKRPRDGSGGGRGLNA